MPLGMTTAVAGGITIAIASGMPAGVLGMTTPVAHSPSGVLGRTTAVAGGMATAVAGGKAAGVVGIGMRTTAGDSPWH